MPNLKEKMQALKTSQTQKAKDNATQVQVAATSSLASASFVDTAVSKTEVEKMINKSKKPTRKFVSILSDIASVTIVACLVALIVGATIKLIILMF